MTIFCQIVSTKVGFSISMVYLSSPILGAQMMDGQNQRSAGMEI